MYVKSEKVGVEILFLFRKRTSSVGSDFHETLGVMVRRHQ